MDQDAKGGLREASIEAVVIRADGSRENLGVVSYYHKNPLKRAMFAVKRKLKERKHGDVRR
jgi:hypothetical protein